MHVLLDCDLRLQTLLDYPLPKHLHYFVQNTLQSITVYSPNCFVPVTPAQLYSSAKHYLLILLGPDIPPSPYNPLQYYPNLLHNTELIYYDQLNRTVQVNTTHIVLQLIALLIPITQYLLIPPRGLPHTIRGDQSVDLLRERGLLNLVGVRKGYYVTVYVVCPRNFGNESRSPFLCFTNLHL